MKRWQTSKAYFWEAAPFFRLLLPIIAAIVCYHKDWLPTVNQVTLIVVLLSALLFTAIALFIQSFAQAFVFARTILIHASLFAAGWFVCFINDVRNNERWFGKQLETAESIQAKIIEQPIEKARTWKLKVELISSYSKDSLQKVKGEAFVYLYKDGNGFNLLQGDEIILPNKWTLIKNAGNPNEFDYASFCSRNNIYHQQFISTNEISVYKKTAYKKSFVDKTHDWAMQALHRYIKDPATLGLMQAMLLGDEVNFDPELRQTYVETGIIHIVAISGGHVIIFFQIIALLFFWLRNKQYKFVKFIVAVPLVCFYVAVAGAPISAIRAAIMFSFVALGLMIQKDKQPLNQLFTTAFFMLLFQPMWLFAVGFQLSFAAVLSLIIFYKPIFHLLPFTNLIIRKIWGAIAASIAAEIIIAPIVIYNFHLFPISFLIANAIAYLFMSFALLAGLIIIAFSKIAIIASFIATVLSYCVYCFHFIIGYFQKLNPVSFKHLHLGLEELILVYIIITAFAIFFLNKQGKGLLIGLAATCLLLSLFINRRWKALHQHQFIAYNINKKNYAEVIAGNRYFPVTNEGSINPATDYAIKELHIATLAWKEGNTIENDIVNINQQTLLLLRQPINIDTTQRLKVDYLFIDYPVKDFNAQELKRLFHFNKLILSSNQKRYIVQQWKDSCLKHRIPTHFTMLDGAFVLK